MDENDWRSLRQVLNGAELRAPTHPPTPEQLGDGRWITRWRVEMAEPIDLSALKHVSSQLEDEMISIEFAHVGMQSVTMTVIRGKDANYTEAFDASIRALLVLEKCLCPISAIEGTPRDTWGYHFVFTERAGALDGDKPPLILAAERGEIDAVKSLLDLDRDVDMNATSLTGGTALMYAAYGAYTEVVAELLARGADVSLPGSEFTLLQAAVAGGSDAVVEMLLEAGADVNASNRYGETALLAAVALRKTKAVEMLLNAGADPNLRDNKGKSALNRLVVRKGVALEITEMLKQAGAKEE